MANEDVINSEDNGANGHLDFNKDSIAAARTKLKKYEKNQEKLIYLAGGVGALLLFGGLIKSAASTAPSLLLALLVTFAIFSGALLAITKIMYESTCDSISSWIEKTSISVSTVEGIENDSDCNLPKGTGLVMWLGVALLILTVIALLGMTWWPVFSNSQSMQDCTASVHGECHRFLHNK